ncbi:MAG: Bcr/CflA family efflux MFS transporter [Deltaproteobacteria bacterium]|nr:MAG: Bcr/CflA family efflux MFS transporter [Deltaproteobacteria bacterium]
MNRAIKASAEFSWPFLILMALLMSFVALAIDMMLPALSQIGTDLHAGGVSQSQMVITSVFLGMGLGLLLFGPLSDAYGRKPALFVGISIFIVGCLFSLFAQSFVWMLVGRMIQGFGGASCRVVTTAMIRDQYEGEVMAKVMSMVLILFILVPAIAPSIGQVILWVFHWRMIFVFMLVLAVISGAWLFLGQKETLAQEHQRPLSFATFRSGALETLTHPVSMGYTLASGLVFGAFVGYLSSAQPILQGLYKLKGMFSLAFGVLALVIGSASFANSRLVERYGMKRLCTLALSLMTILGAIALPLFYTMQGQPPLLLFLSYLAVTFFCAGILFGNFSSMALQPMGHIAGIANSVVSAVQTIVSVFLGGLISAMYNGTVLPLTTGYLCLSLLSLIVVLRTK